jgi:hypothetical protein
MLCAILRHLLSHEYSPFDRFIELGVFVLIAYEVWVTFSHRQKIKSRLGAMLVLMQKGEVVEAAVPRAGNLDVSAISTWNESVNAWVTETSNFLTRHSPTALAIFTHHVGATGMLYGGITKDARDYYDLLLARMNNLRNIMEKVDVYF